MIFQPFKRLVGKNIEGSGLGLSICKKIAEMHGGSIHCESNATEGTTFITTIANSHSEAKSTPVAETEQEEEIEASEGERLADVLLVEDNPADAELTRIKLMDIEHIDFNLHVVTNGQEALNWLHNPEHSRPDLILLDINMPIMDGFKLLENIKSDGEKNSIPICMLSTSDDETDMHIAREKGANGYMVKPANKAQLESTIQHIRSLRLIGEPDRLRLCA